jgi:hypothetical protein
MKYFEVKKSFKKEFKRQIKLAILAAIGFTIAFAWKRAVFDTFLDYVSRFMDLPTSHYLSELYTAVAITFVGVMLIFLTSKLLRDK